MSEASSMGFRVGLWRPHETRGWICRACGHHAKGTTSRLVHERRADRGIGCADAHLMLSERIAELERFADLVLEETAVECDKRAHAGDAGAWMAARAIRAMQKCQPTVQRLPADDTEGGAE